MTSSLPIGIEDGGESTFLWMAPFAPPKGWTNVPRGGMCLSAFLFVMSERKILLGKYADHPAWEQLCGMDNKRIKNNSRGWTIPASHLKFGEDPRDTARRIGEQILTLDKGLVYSEPYVKTFFYEPAIAPGEKHFDVLFLFEASVKAGVKVHTPPWYEALEWFDIGTVQCGQFARQHEDVMEIWLNHVATNTPSQTPSSDSFPRKPIRTVTGIVTKASDGETIQLTTEDM